MSRQSRFVIGLPVVSLMLAAAVAVVAATPQTPAQQAQQPPVFRGRTTIVPIDVRVLDRNGKPVTDLKADDFTITENGVVQKVEYFAPQPLTPTAPEPDLTVRPTTPEEKALGPQTRRLFLIYLGRGRLQEPSKGVDATLRFVRERLLPQDQVAVMAWNRATDFSANHKRAADVIERFRTAHVEIEHELGLYFTGLFGLYAGKEIPAHIQKLIDKVFDISADASTRQVLPSGTLAAESDASRALNDALSRSNPEAYRYFGGSDVQMANGMFDPSLGMSFDDYIVLNRQTMQDVGNLYAGIDFLRFIEGEKHLIFVTEHGFYLPRAEHDRDLASLASDARVALDTVHTGGVAASQGPGGVMTVSHGFNLRALREISDISGGQSSVSRYAEQAYDRILSSTEFGYLLAYSPADTNMDGRMRSIKVTVNRRNVTVAHRRSYAARKDAEKFDPRESLARTRLVAAANHYSEIKDLKFSTKLVEVKEGDQRFAHVEVTVDGSRIRLAKKGDGYIAALNVAIFCGDYDQKDIGQLWESRDVTVPPTRF